MLWKDFSSTNRYSVYFCWLVLSICSVHTTSLHFLYLHLPLSPFTIHDICVTNLVTCFIWINNDSYSIFLGLFCFERYSLGTLKSLTQLLRQIIWRRDFKSTCSQRSFISSRLPGTQTKWNSQFYLDFKNTWLLCLAIKQDNEIYKTLLWPIYLLVQAICLILYVWILGGQ
jgi:hypothetical protein